MKIVMTIILSILLEVATAQVHYNIDSLNAAIAGNDNDSIRIRLYLDAAYVYQYTRPDHARAKDYYNKALALAKKHDWQWAIYRCYRSQSNWGSMRGDYTNAFEYDKLALQIAIEYDSTKIPLAILDISDDYIGLGNYGLAYHYLKISERLLAKDTLNLIIANLNLGILFKEIDQHALAIKQLKVTHKMADDFNDQEGVTYALVEMGDTYINAGEFDSAKSVLDSALESSLQSDLKWLTSESLFRLGKLHVRTGELKKAEYYLDTALVRFKEVYNIYGQMSANLGLMYTYLGLGNTTRAKSHLDAASILMNRMNAIKMKAKILYAHSKYYEAVGDMKLSLGYMEKYADYCLLMNSNGLVEEMQADHDAYDEFVIQSPAIVRPEEDRFMGAVKTIITDRRFIASIIVLVILLSGFMIFQRYRKDDVQDI